MDEAERARLAALLPLARLEREIEHMVDQHGMDEVLRAVARVCEAKGMKALALKLFRLGPAG